jgi:hypothetical protein
LLEERSDGTVRQGNGYSIPTKEGLRMMSKLTSVALAGLLATSFMATGCTNRADERAEKAAMRAEDAARRAESAAGRVEAAARRAEEAAEKAMSGHRGYNK